MNVLSVQNKYSNLCQSELLNSNQNNNKSAAKISTFCLLLLHFKLSAIMDITVGNTSSATCTLRNDKRSRRAITSIAVQAYSFIAYRT